MDAAECPVRERVLATPGIPGMAALTFSPDASLAARHVPTRPPSHQTHLPRQCPYRRHPFMQGRKDVPFTPGYRTPGSLLHVVPTSPAFPAAYAGLLLAEFPLPLETVTHPPLLALQDLVLQQPSFSVIESVVFTSGSIVAAAKSTQAHVPHFHKLKCSARVAVPTLPGRSVPKAHLVGHGVFKGITLHSVSLFPLSQRTDPDKVAATAALLNGLTLRLVHRGVTTQCPPSLDRVFHPATSIMGTDETTRPASHIY